MKREEFESKILMRPSESPIAVTYRGRISSFISSGDEIVCHTNKNPDEDFGRVKIKVDKIKDNIVHGTVITPGLFKFGEEVSFATSYAFACSKQ